MLRAPIRLGLQIPNFNFPGVSEGELFERLSEVATTAESSGIDTVLVMDHLHQIRGVGPPENWMLEGNAILGALAARTERVNLSLLVGATTYRNPALHAKLTTTLDVISGGRAMFGLGAAWNDVEHDGYGFEFPPVRERMDRLDEALTIVRKMFTEERPSFEGRHYRIHEALNEPRPVQPGGPRIMVGGGGEQRTLRIAAKHADMTHWFAIGTEALMRKNEVLERYCAEIGRDPGTIERTMGAPVIVAADEAEATTILERMPEDRRPFAKVGTPEQMAGAMRPYLDAGFTGFTFNNSLYRTPEQIARVGELLALVA